MTDEFANLIDRSNQFFAELKQNNRKDWYEPRKTFYISEIKKPAELLADLLAEDLHRLTGKAHRPKLFRIYRDVRFSKDKTPYNAHLHLMWRQAADENPVWFFGSSPDYLILGMGMMGLQGAALTRFREFIDRRGAELQSAISTAADTAGASISDWGPAPLKRVPSPYGADHPQADFLKRKALAVSAPLPDGWASAGLVTSIQSVMQSLRPIWLLFDREFGQG